MGMRLCRYFLPYRLSPYRLMIILILNEVVSCHFFWLLDTEDMAERRCYIGEDTILELCVGMLFAHIYEWY